MAESDWDASKQLLTMDGTPICPVCKTPFESNHVLQCMNGHIFCQKCAPVTSQGRHKPNINTIPKGCRDQCFQDYPQILARNRIMEHFAFGTSVFDLLGVSTDILTSEPNNENSTPAAPPPELLPKVTHPGIFCYGIDCEVKSRETGMNVPITGTRYKCLECKNFNVCKNCMDTESHGHAFLVIETPEMAATADQIRQLQKSRLTNDKPMMPKLPAATKLNNYTYGL